MLGTDFSGTPSNETFISGSSDGDVVCTTIMLLDDDALEGNQTFTLSIIRALDDDPGVLIGINTTIITLTDNDG